MSQTAKNKAMALAKWDPENTEFWENNGKKIAWQNLWISVPCLFLSFAIWVIWSAVLVNLNNIGFHFTQVELFTLAAIPGLTGSTLRILYSFVVPIFGGKNWTVLSTASLLVPTLWLGHAVQDPTTSYHTLLIIAALCGFGGGNFSSSMANISFFFPKKSQGTALGINAGLGNLGVSGLQFTAPFVASLSLFGAFGGAPQNWTNGLLTKSIWLQNIAYIWVLPIVLCTLLAWLLMSNLYTTKTSLKEQLVIFKRKHLYITTSLYVMSFGSFIGYSVALPLLIKIEFPLINPLTYAFLGPLLGALIRPVGGWMADKTSGALVTFWSTCLMILGVMGIYYFIQPDNKEFWLFLTSFLLLFVATGLANGSIFRMIGVIFVPKEKAPVLGMTAAIAAYGAFFIPKIFAMSIEFTHSVNNALWAFLAYYIVCLFITWWWYLRKNAEIRC